MNIFQRFLLKERDNPEKRYYVNTELSLTCRCARSKLAVHEHPWINRAYTKLKVTATVFDFFNRLALQTRLMAQSSPEKRALRR